RIENRDYKVFVLLGDGELQEGQVWEAALSAAHHRASNLIAVLDRNEYSLDGRVEEINSVEPLEDKWRSFGWHVERVDGHDVERLTTLLAQLRADENREGPALVI